MRGTSLSSSKRAPAKPQAFPLSPKPRRVWEWSRCYYAVGERVTVREVTRIDYRGVITGHVRNRRGRVSYWVKSSASETRIALLEDLCGWYSLPIDYRERHTLRQLAGKHPGRLVFPIRRGR